MKPITYHWLRHRKDITIGVVESARQSPGKLDVLPLVFSNRNVGRSKCNQRNQMDQHRSELTYIAECPLLEEPDRRRVPTSMQILPCYHAKKHRLASSICSTLSINYRFSEVKAEIPSIVSFVTDILLKPRCLVSTSTRYVLAPAGMSDEHIEIAKDLAYFGLEKDSRYLGIQTNGQEGDIRVHSPFLQLIWVLMDGQSVKVND